MTTQIEIEELTRAQPLLVVRRKASRTELTRVVPEACGAVWNVIKAKKIQGAGRNIAVYLDMVFNLEIGVEMANPPCLTPLFESGDQPAAAKPDGEDSGHQY